jgi:hypothetical protein
MSFLHAQNEKSGFEFPLCGGGGMMTKESLAIPKLPAFCRTYGVSQGERSRSAQLASDQEGVTATSGRAWEAVWSEGIT